mmetsp:Transcript_9904/g.15225  ORF Transcript_9904/g.15225 Transcript_9904/m.15225 type:complete len:177 (-) Transcript_9904:585-1115(-)
MYGITTPKPWQVQLVYHCVYSSNRRSIRALLIHQTSAGKTLAMWTVATMHRHITIVVTPLLALSADHVSNLHHQSNPRAGICAEHLDSLRDAEDASLMLNFLQSGALDNVSNVSIILCVSPEALAVPWGRMNSNLHSRSLIRFLVVDKAQHITQSGRNFCPVFFTNFMFCCLCLSF